jgi:hypothetical protein
MIRPSARAIHAHSACIPALPRPCHRAHRAGRTPHPHRPGPHRPHRLHPPHRGRAGTGPPAGDRSRAHLARPSRPPAPCLAGAHWARRAHHRSPRHGRHGPPLGFPPGARRRPARAVRPRTADRDRHPRRPLRLPAAQRPARDGAGLPARGSGQAGLLCRRHRPVRRDEGPGRRWPGRSAAPRMGLGPAAGRGPPGPGARRRRRRPAGCPPHAAYPLGHAVANRHAMAAQPAARSTASPGRRGRAAWPRHPGRVRGAGRAGCRWLSPWR